MGFDVREPFIYQPAEVYILEERIYKYGCRCGEVVVTAEPTEPPKPIPGGMAPARTSADLPYTEARSNVTFGLGTPTDRHARRAGIRTVNVVP